MGLPSSAVFAVLRLLPAALATPKFQLGVCYTYDGISQIGPMDFAAKIALEEGFFNDIMRTSDFEIEITSVDTKCRPSIAAQVSLPFFLGRGQQPGRIYSDTEDLPPVIAINGCACSSVSKVFANQGVSFGVPMISGTSTSPDLSNKHSYPYFSRTVPPDNMQGRGLAKLAYESGWRRLFGIHIEGDSYGEGVIQEVCSASRSFGIECVLKKLPYIYVESPSNLPIDYDGPLAAAKAIAAETPQPRIFVVAPIQAASVIHVMHAAGLTGPKYHWMFSEIACSLRGLTVGPAQDLQAFAAREPDNPLWDSSSAAGSVWERIPSLMRGMTCLMPEAQGPRLQSSAFTNFWAGVSLEKLEAAGYVRHSSWSDSWLPIENWLPPFQALHFDGMTTILVAISSMLARGVTPEDVRGEALNAEIRATKFEGLTGDIAFDSSGDRLAPYGIYNVRAPGFDFGNESSPNPHFVQVGVFNGATSTISFASGTPILYADGTATPPEDKPGSCSPGTEFSAAESKCVDCPMGKENRFSDDEVVGARCLPCAAGTFAAATGMSECTPAEASYFVAEDGATAQEPCPPSTYTAYFGQSECLACAPGRYGSEFAMTACVPAGEGHYVNKSGSTGQIPCPEGFFGEFEEMVECDRCAAGTFSDTTGQTACPRCEIGAYSDRGAATCTSCVAFGSLLTTKYQGSTGQEDCVCPEDTYRDATDRSACHPCPEGMSCEEGSDLRSFGDLFKSGGRSNATTIGGTYPVLWPGYWSSVDDPVFVFSCANQDRCPGGKPGTCAPNTEGIACARCIDEHYATAQQCDKCADIEKSKITFPIIPIALGPIVISVLYRTSRDGPDKWGSWRNGLTSVAFLTLNHYQIVSLGTSMELQLPVDLQDLWRVWALSGDVLSIFKLDCAGFGSFQAGVLLRCVGPLVFLALVFLTYCVSNAVGKIFKPELAMQGDVLCNVYMSVINTFFTGIAAMSLSLFQCTWNPSGKATLMIDRSVLCYESDWNSMVVVSVLAVAVYCGGCFVLFAYIIWVAPTAFHQEGFQRRWKFLFIKYRVDVHWWGLAILAKNMSINLGPTFFDVAPGQLYWMVLSCALYIAGVTIFSPWRSRCATILDVVLHEAVIIVLMSLAWFSRGDTALDRGMTMITAIMSCFPLLAALIAIGALVAPAAIKRANPEWHREKQIQLQEDLQKVAKVLSSLDPMAIQDMFQALQEYDQRVLAKATECIHSEVLGRTSARLSARSSHHLVNKMSRSMSRSSADQTPKGMEAKDKHTEVSMECSVCKVDAEWIACDLGKFDVETEHIFARQPFRTVCDGAGATGSELQQDIGEAVDAPPPFPWPADPDDNMLCDSNDIAVEGTANDCPQMQLRQLQPAEPLFPEPTDKQSGSDFEHGEDR